MAMTREQVLAQMEADYEIMPDEIRNKVLFTEEGVDYTPTLLIAEVRNDTDFGKRYVQSWARNVEEQSALFDLLGVLLGGDGMTCGDPDCPNCKGEVRPFNQKTGSDPTIH
jgi:hypothetical protein